MKEKSKNPVGRPLELTQELIDKANEYASGGYLTRGEVIPSLAGLSCYVGKGRQTLRDYGEINEEFSTTLEAIQCHQHVLALNKGLTSEFNSAITKLVLFNHGYHDKVEQTNDTASIADALQAIADKLPD